MSTILSNGKWRQVKKIELTKFQLFNAFANGKPCNELGLNVINAIEREDGSNRSYNVRGDGYMGKELTIHVHTKD